MLDLRTGNCLDILPQLAADSVQCCVTSPPYWGLRDYGVDGQFGLEETPEAYVANMVAVFREVWRVLRDGGTLWLNLGDTYTGRKGWRPEDQKTSTLGSQRDGLRPNAAFIQKPKGFSIPNGLKSKDIVGIPWRVAFALQSDRWYLRSDIIWHKPNPMPESVTDRPTKAHEYIFLLSKSERYFFDNEAIKEPSIDPESLNGMRPRYHSSLGESDPNGFGRTRVGFLKLNGQVYERRNRRTVWTIATQPYTEAHFATFPEQLPKLCILAGSKAGDTILDPFAGSGTVGQVALELGRKAILIELNPDYVQLAKHRTWVTPGLLF